MSRFTSVGAAAAAPSSQGSGESRYPIDAVYLWVDGAAPGTRERLAAARTLDPPELPESAEEHRFRDNGELRYSLRSLERCAPWVRHIHLVTDGEVPGWLDTSHPRLSVVSHSQVFQEPSSLPSFNSDAISLQLHRVPGVARHYLLINDDCLLGQPVAPSDFLFADGRPVVYLDEFAVPSDPRAGPVHDRALAYTRELIERWLGDGSAAGVFAHTPQLYDRDLLAELERLWPEEFRAASAATFRSPGSLVLRLLYPAAALAGVSGSPPGVPRVLHTGSSEYCIVRLSPDPIGVLRDLSYVARLRPRFLCVNDELGSGKLGRDLAATIELVLRKMYPEPSSFELDAQQRHPPHHSIDRVAADYWSRRLAGSWSDAGVGSLAYGVQFNAWRNRVRVAVMRRAVRELQLDLAATRVLEVGAGTGLHLREWIRLGVKELAGVDIAEAAVERLRAELPGVGLRRADVGGAPLPFAPGSFDVVCAFAVLFHIADERRYRRALANMSAVIGPGGYLLLTECPLPSGERRAGDYWTARSDAFVESAIAAAGLQPVSCRAEAVLTSPPHRLGPGWAARWERLMQPVRGSERVGWAVGAAVYPLELALTAAIRRGPSTRLFVSRKPG